MADHDEDDDGLSFPENDERAWRGYLGAFRSEVYPVFEAHGFTLPEAFLAWQMNRVYNNLNQVIDELHGDDAGGLSGP